MEKRHFGLKSVAKIANLYETRSAKAHFLIKKSKTGLRKVRKDVFRKKEACAGCAKGNLKNKRFAHGAQGRFLGKSCLRKLRKALLKQNGVCARCARVFKIKMVFAPTAHGCFSVKTGLRNVRKGEMKRKGFAAKEFFRNFAEKWRYDVITK